MTNLTDATRIYEVWWDASSPMHCIAVCFDFKAAADLSSQINDEHECEVCSIAVVDLIDNYGYPFPARDLGVVWPDRYTVGG